MPGHRKPGDQRIRLRIRDCSRRRHIKKGISIWAFPTDWSLARCFSLAAQAGFDGIELAYDLKGPVHAGVPASDLQAIRQQAKDAGLELSSLATGVFWQFNVISHSDDERTEAKRHLNHLLELAAGLEVQCVLVVPGFVGPFEAGAPVVKDYDTAFKRAIDDFQQVAVTAERLGVTIGIENVWNKFLTSAWEMRAFIDSVNSPFVGAYFDVGNCLRTGYPEQWIRMLGSRIKSVHFKDFRVNVGNLQGFVDLGEGDVDYPVVMSALKGIDYTGYCVVEVFSRARYPESVVLRAGADIARIFAEDAK
jgi:L-ribulose-5-phosphate 3-epimerase